jgi:hypothetical protein
MNQFLIASVVMALVACGKSGGDGDKAGGAGATASAPAAGPSCAETAARYAKLNADGGGNYLAKLKPTPEQLTAVTAKLEAHCTSTKWSAENKKCVMDATSDLDISMKCFKSPKGFGLQVSQVVFDFVKEAGSAN